MTKQQFQRAKELMEDIEHQKEILGWLRTNMSEVNKIAAIIAFPNGQKIGNIDPSIIGRILSTEIDSTCEFIKDLEASLEEL